MTNPHFNEDFPEPQSDTKTAYITADDWVGLNGAWPSPYTVYDSMDDLKHWEPDYKRYGIATVEMRLVSLTKSEDV